jgi:hypothetical protein
MLDVIKGVFMVDPVDKPSEIANANVSKIDANIPKVEKENIIVVTGKFVGRFVRNIADNLILRLYILVKYRSMMKADDNFQVDLADKFPTMPKMVQGSVSRLYPRIDKDYNLISTLVEVSDCFKDASVAVLKYFDGIEQLKYIGGSTEERKLKVSNLNDGVRLNPYNFTEACEKADTPTFKKILEMTNNLIEQKILSTDSITQMFQSGGGVNSYLLEEGFLNRDIPSNEKVKNNLEKFKLLLDFLWSLDISEKSKLETITSLHRDIHDNPLVTCFANRRSMGAKYYDKISEIRNYYFNFIVSRLEVIKDEEAKTYLTDGLRNFCLQITDKLLELPKVYQPFIDFIIKTNIFNSGEKEECIKNICITAEPSYFHIRRKEMLKYCLEKVRTSEILNKNQKLGVFNQLTTTIPIALKENNLDYLKAYIEEVLLIANTIDDSNDKLGLFWNSELSKLSATNMEENTFDEYIRIIEENKHLNDKDIILDMLKREKYSMYNKRV